MSPSVHAAAAPRSRRAVAPDAAPDAPGASLGGARPKANLQDGEGRLWIAEFPGADDDHDWALREMLVHQLAQAFGLNVSPARLERIGHGHHTFVTQRFDRDEGGRRRFFTSAMAVLGRTDRDEASYLDLARLRQVPSTWQDTARVLGLSAEDRAEFEDCFLV